VLIGSNGSEKGVVGVADFSQLRDWADRQAGK
jgi:hypothetical protein